MNDVQVQDILAQSLQRRLEGCPCMVEAHLVRRAFGLQPYPFALRVLRLPAPHSGTDCLLVLVDGGGVDEAVAGLQGVGDGGVAIGTFQLERAESEPRHRKAPPQLHRLGHGQGRRIDSSKAADGRREAVSRIATFRRQHRETWQALTPAGREPDEGKALTFEGQGPVALRPAVELQGAVADVADLALDDELPSGVVAQAEDQGDALPGACAGVDMGEELRMLVHRNGAARRSVRPQQRLQLEGPSGELREEPVGPGGLEGRRHGAEGEGAAGTTVLAQSVGLDDLLPALRDAGPAAAFVGRAQQPEHLGADLRHPLHLLHLLLILLTGRGARASASNASLGRHRLRRGPRPSRESSRSLGQQVRRREELLVEPCLEDSTPRSRNEQVLQMRPPGQRIGTLHEGLQEVVELLSEDAPVEKHRPLGHGGHSREALLAQGVVQEAIRQATARQGDGNAHHALELAHEQSIHSSRQCAHWGAHAMRLLLGHTVTGAEPVHPAPGGPLVRAQPGGRREVVQPVLAFQAPHHRLQPRVLLQDGCATRAGAPPGVPSAALDMAAGGHRRGLDHALVFLVASVQQPRGSGGRRRGDLVAEQERGRHQAVVAAPEAAGVGLERVREALRAAQDPDRRRQGGVGPGAPSRPLCLGHHLREEAQHLAGAGHVRGQARHLFCSLRGKDRPRRAPPRRIALPRRAM
mmetsp:Transcript_124306/g.397982  ORF Transcript_124306/g.397982 Transcript_124306/m.397982 type:complete len:694 (-) Transcript_124306:72-2153(-)